MQLKIKNQEAINKQRQALISTKISVSTYQTLYSFTLKNTVEAHLKDVLSSSEIKHFDVVIFGSGRAPRVSVVTLDQIGTFIYEGTKAHTETASAGTAIPFYGRYASTVRHPGTASKKKEIGDAVKAAKLEAAEIMKGFGRK